MTNERFYYEANPFCNIFWFQIDKKTNVISLDLICVLSETKINRTTKIICIKCIY